MRTEHGLHTAEVRPGPAEGKANGNRARSLLTNRPLRNSSYSQPGLEVGAGSSFRMRKEALPAPPAARGGRSLRGGASLWRYEPRRLIRSSYEFAYSYYAKLVCGSTYII